MAQLPAKFLNFQLGNDHLTSLMNDDVSDGTARIKDLKEFTHQNNVKRITELNNLLAKEAKRLQEELNKGIQRTEQVQQELALFVLESEPEGKAVAQMKSQRDALLSNIDKLNDDLLRMATEKEKYETKIEHLEDSVRQHEKKQRLLLARIHSLEKANSSLSDNANERDKECQQRFAQINVLEEANSQLRKTVKEHEEMRGHLLARVQCLEEENTRLSESAADRNHLLTRVDCLERKNKNMSDHVCLLLSDIEQLYNKARHSAVGLNHLDEVNRLKSERSRIVKHSIKMEKFSTQLCLENKFLRYQILQLEEDVDRRIGVWAIDVEKTVLQRLQNVESRIEVVDDRAMKTLKRNEQIHAEKVKQMTVILADLGTQVAAKKKEVEVEKKNKARFQSERDLLKNRLQEVEKELKKEELVTQLQSERDQLKSGVEVAGKEDKKKSEEELQYKLEKAVKRQKEMTMLMSKAQSERDKLRNEGNEREKQWQSEMNQLKKRLEESENQKNSFQTHVSKNQSERDLLKNRLAETEKKRNELEKDYNKLKSAAEKTKNEMSAMRSRIADLEKRVAERESNIQCSQSTVSEMSRSSSPTLNLGSTAMHNPSASIVPVSVFMNMKSHALKHRFPNILIFDYHGPNFFIMFHQCDLRHIAVCSLRNILESHLNGRNLRLYLTTARSVNCSQHIQQVWADFTNGLCQWKFASLDGEEFYDKEYSHRNTALLTNDLEILTIPRAQCLWIYVR